MSYSQGPGPERAGIGDCLVTVLKDGLWSPHIIHKVETSAGRKFSGCRVGHCSSTLKYLAAQTASPLT